MIYEDDEIDKLKEMLDCLYNQKKKNNNEITEYKKYLTSIQEEISEKKDKLDDTLANYRFQKVISFLTFVLAFLINDKINNNSDLANMQTTKKLIVETLELINYFLPVASLINVEVLNKDKKQSAKELKYELIDMKSKLKEYKLKYRHLKLEEQLLDEMILSCYTKITDIREYNKTKKIEY